MFVEQQLGTSSSFSTPQPTLASFAACSCLSFHTFFFITTLFFFLSFSPFFLFPLLLQLCTPSPFPFLLHFLFLILIRCILSLFSCTYFFVSSFPSFRFSPFRGLLFLLINSLHQLTRSLSPVHYHFQHHTPLLLSNHPSLAHHFH